jgi:energy-coupling factor transporter ATP-binding protein EcfA2
LSACKVSGTGNPYSRKISTKIYSEAVFGCTNMHVHSEALKETQVWYALRELVLTANNNASIPRVRS